MRVISEFNFLNIYTRQQYLFTSLYIGDYKYPGHVHKLTDTIIDLNAFENLVSYSKKWEFPHSKSIFINISNSKRGKPHFFF